MLFRRIFFENFGGEYLGESFLVLSSMGGGCYLEESFWFWGGGLCYSIFY
jgi:hypothetical protein